MSDETSASGTAIAFSQSTGLETRADGTAEGLVVIARRDPADWSADCLNRMKRLCELKQNWDSYGANPVDPGSIEVAKQLVRMFAQMTGIDCPRVAASPAGHVALSWEWQEHSRELDLEILPGGMIRWSCIDDHQPSEDCEGESNDINQVVRLVRAFGNKGNPQGDSKTLCTYGGK